MRQVILIVILLCIFLNTPHTSTYTDKAKDLAPQKLGQINTLSYNVWGLPVWLPKVGLNNRFQKISEKLVADNYDIVCLQECFSKRFRKKVLSELGDRYYYASDYRKDRRSFLGITNDQYGGLMTFSKYPIVDEHFYPYPHSKKMKKTEQIGRKGFLVSKIITPDSDTLCVINTHLYAGANYKDEAFRYIQITHMDSVLRADGYTEYTCILQGDINVDHPEVAAKRGKKRSTVYDYIVEVMGFEDSASELKEEYYTVDHSRNAYSSRADGKQKLDYIFHRTKGNESWECESMQSLYADEYSYSDHLAWNVVYRYR